MLQADGLQPNKGLVERVNDLKVSVERFKSLRANGQFNSQHLDKIVSEIEMILSVQEYILKSLKKEISMQDQAVHNVGWISVDLEANDVFDADSIYLVEVNYGKRNNLQQGKEYFSRYLFSYASPSVIINKGNGPSF